MANLNQCNFIGNLTRSPEIKTLYDGSSMCKVSIAINESWKDKATGEKQEKTEFVNVIAFKRLAEVMGDYLKKGASVFISGKFQTRKWEDKEGNNRYTTEIIANQMQMLGGKGQGGQGDQGDQGSQISQERAAIRQSSPQQPSLADDVFGQLHDSDEPPF